MASPLFLSVCLLAKKNSTPGNLPELMQNYEQTNDNGRLQGSHKTIILEKR